MSEDEIIKDLKNFIALAQKEENFIYYSEYKFDNELSERVQGLLDLYNKEKDLNNELQIRYKIEHEKYLKEKEKNKQLEMKLKYDIEQINKKITSDEYINDYRVARLKGIRTKSKELLKLLEERN